MKDINRFSEANLTLTESILPETRSLSSNYDLERGIIVGHLTQIEFHNVIKHDKSCDDMTIGQ